ncbi:MAG: 50S ribosomal protein L11 methyltransferase [Candidatus Thorarchaeota archaeon]|jgi:16S rRNA G966 N2-methylase RsmD
MDEYSTPFSILHAASLLSHRSRLSKFDEALKRVMTEDSYVVDLGTGTGVLAMMAARAGAKKVTAVEIDRISVEYAKNAIKQNGLEDVIEVVRSHYANFKPREKADIVTCEMLSSAMLVEPQVPASQWAMESILKDKGILLPRSATVYIAPVECHSVWERFSTAGFDFPRVPQTMDRDASRDLADLAILEEFDFFLHQDEWNVDRNLEFNIVSNGTVHGLMGMFEAHLTDDIKLTMEDGWRNLLLPLAEPVSVSQGDILSADVFYSPAIINSLRLSCHLVDTPSKIRNHQQ